MTTRTLPKLSAIGAAGLFNQAHSDQLISQLRRENAQKDDEIRRLREQIAAFEDAGMRAESRPARRRTTRGTRSNRGRNRAQDVITLNGVEYWSVSYVARNCHLSQATISRRATSGEISYVTFGGTYYIAAEKARTLRTKHAHR